MATIKSFEDLYSWQTANSITRSVYQLSETGAFAKDFALRNQIRAAAVSIGANIAEGFDRRGDAEFHQFLTIAKGSAGEVRALAYSAEAAGYLSPDQFKAIAAQTQTCQKMIEGMMRYLKTKGKKKRKAGKSKT